MRQLFAFAVGLALILLSSTGTSSAQTIPLVFENFYNPPFPNLPPGWTTTTNRLPTGDWYDTTFSGVPGSIRVANCVEYGCPDPDDRLGKPSSQLLLPQDDVSALEEGICKEEVECPDEEAGKVKPLVEQTVAPGGGKVPEADRKEGASPFQGKEYG